MVWVWYDVMNKCDQKVKLSNKNAPVAMSAICVGEYNWKKNVLFGNIDLFIKKTEKSKHDNQSRNLAFEYFPSPHIHTHTHNHAHKNKSVHH